MLSWLMILNTADLILKNMLKESEQSLNHNWELKVTVVLDRVCLFQCFYLEDITQAVPER